MQDKDDIPDELLEHLRYPEDMFKAQRYQFARYHVTDAGDFYQGNNRWEVPQDPESPGHYQPPYRMFVNQPDGSGAVLRPDLGVRAARQEQPGVLRVGELRRDRRGRTTAP